MNIRTDILLRVYIAFGLILLFAFAVLYQLFHVQFAQGSHWRAVSDSLSTKFVNIEAVRGNIYSIDGSLLATSVPEYELRMDLLAGGIEKNDVFYEKIDSLAEKLSTYFKDKSTHEYSRMLRSARQDSARYFLIQRAVTYQQLKQIKQFPIFRMGRYKGGLIAVQKNKRILPFQYLAARTIGYKKENVQPVGLEGAYGKYIDGESGKRLVQRIAGGVWMPVNPDMEIAPKEGADIISTIDINMQDVAHNALLKQLIASNADHGCVVLMEVATGEIRAVVNLTKTSMGNYEEKFNYAIAESAEPGSTFKLASYLVAMDDGKFDLDDLVDTEGGKYKVHNHTIKDSHEGGYGVIPMNKAFEVSSNVAITKMIMKNYAHQSSQFTSKLHELHLGEPLELQIPGEGMPLIKTPKSNTWSKLTLAQMAYGYELKMTPLQMLTLYNAIANNASMIAPLFVKEIRRLGNTIEMFQPRVIHNKICSDATLSKLQDMLEGVVADKGGTGEKLNNPLYKIAGKTGTAQVAQGATGYRAKRAYQASFCGYFPADKPKYSMIVVVQNPTQGSYYAADVAGPVFREIADRVYAVDLDISHTMKIQQAASFQPEMIVKQGFPEDLSHIYHALGMNNFNNDKKSDLRQLREEKQYTSGTVPNVKGMGLRDALYTLSNSGIHRLIIRGSGKVVRQSVQPGIQITKNYPVVIELN